MRRFLVTATAGAVSPFLVFLVGSLFLPAIDGLLVWPGARASRVLGIQEEGANLAVGIAISWMLWAAAFAAIIAVTVHFLWPRRKLFWVCTIVVVVVLFLEALGTHNKEYDGTWEFGFERSDFYPGGGCWRLPYWLKSTSELSGPSGRLEVLGNPPAVRLRFIGETTSVGEYGHLGLYLREIRVVRVIEVRAAQPCRP